VILRPDQQDYEGTSVTVRVARRLGVPRMKLIVNKTPAIFDTQHVRTEVETAYDCEVAAVLPHSDEMMALSSREIFSLRYPDHPISTLYRSVAGALVE
jgi:MinD-like ATPase involved in chromosome partitioning or flagellar assembly